MHPLQRDCDPGDPKQHASWCWAAGIPDPAPSRPVPIPLIGPMLVEGVSQLLWNFGFRHHPELQTSWIEGNAGLGMVAKLSDSKPVEEDFTESAMAFLADTNPELLTKLKNSDSKSREQILGSLEKNLEQLRGLIDFLKD